MVEYGLPDGGNDDENNGVSLVKMSYMLVIQDPFFFGRDIIWTNKQR